MDKISYKKPPSFFQLVKSGLLIFVAFFLSATSIEVYAQFGISFSGATYFDGNTFRNYENIPDVIYQPSVGIHYDFPADLSQYRIAYEGFLSVFSEYSERVFQFHSLAFNASNIISETGPVLAWGMQGGKRINQQDYNYYDYNTFEGHAHLLFDGNTTWVLGINTRYQDYEQLPQFSFLETTAFFRANYYFQTKTTVIGLFTIGYKHFTEPMVEEELYYFSTGMGSKGNGRGHGYGTQQNPGAEMQDSTIFVRVESQKDNVLQLIASLRIAQSLREKTGIALQGTVQRNPGLGGRVLAGQDFGYESEDDLFDDPYSYESDEVSLEITNIFPWSIQGKVGFELQDKRYDRAAYDLEGVPLEGMSRTDKRKLLWFTLDKSLPISNRMRFTVSFSYLDITNDSNDVYFNYSNKITTAAIGVSF